ncbi:MAG: UDP-3-O-(3-hydroxymyristoyl)glucosamine N-acyltransferase [Arcobacteraceae bacterium]|nr:UDP-3-O-(3-hydroxymyristoyl)glucosamine N-acyltransferase [Arcobacteraceae bacterium]
MILSSIAKELNLESNSDINIIGLNTLKDATANEISFLENKKYLSQLKDTKAGAVFVTSQFKEEVPLDTIALVCDVPYESLAKASKIFAPALVEINGAKPKIGTNCNIMLNVHIGLNTTIGDNCTLMAGAFIGDNVTIGDNCVIYPNVTIYRDCIVGDDVMIHSGTVIGSDGFGFATTKTGQHIKIYQNGNVKIGSNVEIGANCTIDRAVFSSTIIEDLVRIDNLVHIAHNCKIGYGCIFAGQAGLSGSSVLGKYVVMAGQSATTGHLEIAPYTTIAGRGVVSKSIVEPKKQWAGFPLMEHRTWLKLQGRISRLLQKDK